MAHYLLQHHH